MSWIGGLAVGGVGGGKVIGPPVGFGGGGGKRMVWTVGWWEGVGVGWVVGALSVV